MTALQDSFTKTLTWDRGSEMARHTHITKQTSINVYFATLPPWQRGTNENTNGLIHEYLPKGTDLSVHTASDLRAIANQLNDRPHKRLGYHTPSEMLASLLLQEILPRSAYQLMPRTAPAGTGREQTTHGCGRRAG